jgi:hypothetical protein
MAREYLAATWNGVQLHQRDIAAVADVGMTMQLLTLLDRGLRGPRQSFKHSSPYPEWQVARLKGPMCFAFQVEAPNFITSYELVCVSVASADFKMRAKKHHIPRFERLRLCMCKNPFETIRHSTHGPRTELAKSEISIKRLSDD